MYRPYWDEASRSETDADFETSYVHANTVFATIPWNATHSVSHASFFAHIFFHFFIEFIYSIYHVDYIQKVRHNNMDVENDQSSVLSKSPKGKNRTSDK